MSLASEYIKHTFFILSVLSIMSSIKKRTNMLMLKIFSVKYSD